MNYLCIEFQEEYKRLDHLCKDYLRSKEGVSEYIRQMESTSWRERGYVYTWEEDYKQLKHIRWVRNQLAHEVGTLNSDICSEEDLAYVKSFYSRIMSGNDPFTLVRKAKEKQKNQRKQQVPTREQTTTKTSKPAQQSVSLWDKLIAIIRDFFS